jgi:anti-anti-sigma regulatory factor
VKEGDLIFCRGNLHSQALGGYNTVQLAAALSVGAQAGGYMGHNIVDIREHCGPSGVYIASPRRGVTKIVTELDVEHFGQNMMAFILNDAPARAAVVLDLGRTSAFSSATFVALIRAKRALQQSGGELHIADVPPKVMKVLTDLRLAEVLNLYPGESASDVAGQLRRDRIASNGAGPAH